MLKRLRLEGMTQTMDFTGKAGDGLLVLDGFGMFWARFLDKDIRCLREHWQGTQGELPIKCRGNTCNDSCETMPQFGAGSGLESRASSPRFTEGLLQCLVVLTRLFSTLASVVMIPIDFHMGLFETRKSPVLYIGFEPHVPHQHLPWWVYLNCRHS